MDFHYILIQIEEFVEKIQMLVKLKQLPFAIKKKIIQENENIVKCLTVSLSIFNESLKTAYIL